MRFEVAFVFLGFIHRVEGDCGLNGPRTVLRGMENDATIVISKPLLKIGSQADIVVQSIV